MPGVLDWLVPPCVAAMYRQLTHAGAPDSGWINVGIFLVFSALFGYLYKASPAGYRLHARGRPA